MVELNHGIALECSVLWLGAPVSFLARVKQLAIRVPASL